MRVRLKFTLMVLALLAASSASAEILSIEGTPVKEGDIIQVRLRDLLPTQPVVGFDEIYYKLGRFAQDRRKVFREYCKRNGQEELLDFTPESNLQNPSSFVCKGPVGMQRAEVKTVVIGPDNKLYLTNGHHSFILFWNYEGGGPDVSMHVVVARDYRWLTSMDAFWEQMQSDQNVWLYDGNGQPVDVKDLPESFALANFRDDPYRSLMYFTRRIAWNSPEKFVVPDTDETYPAIPFVEFYWAKEIRKTVDLSTYDLYSRTGYLAAIRAVGQAIINVRTNDVGGSRKTLEEVGQFRYFNEKELARIDRPETGKLAYMLQYKNQHRPEQRASRQRMQARNEQDVLRVSD